MKNWMKKMLAALAALAVMVSVVVSPCGVEPEEETLPDIWNEESLSNRN